MLKPTPSKPGLFSVALKQWTAFRGIAVACSIALVLSVLYLVSSTPLVASAATNNTINFQARLESASGAIVPDGNYDVEFKLYNVASAGTAEWAEDYTYNSGSGGTDARIHVANGYLTVNLGTISSFPTTINWDQQQWLTMNIGGTVSSGTITWDGEMSPRLQLTAVPYALRAGSLATGNGTLQSTLSITQPTVGNQTFVIPDMAAAGTYTLLTTGNGVQLQSTTPGTQQTGNFNISGTGIAGAGVQTPSLDTTSAGGTLTIGGTYATGITLGQNATFANGANRALVIAAATSGAGNQLTIHAGNGATGNVGGNLLLEAGANGTANGTPGSVIIKANGGDSTTAFQVQKSAGGTPVLNVDTTNGYVGIGTASPGRALDVAVNNTQIAAPMGLLEQAGTGDSSMEFKDPSDSIYIGQDASSGDNLVIASSTSATHDRAGAPYTLGYSSIADSFEDSGNSGLISSMPFTTSLGGSISQISVDFASGVGDNFAVAVYADSGSNSPGTLLGTSPSTSISIPNSGGDNWDTATLSSPVTLSATTKYWLAYETQNGTATYWLDNTKGTTCWQTIKNATFGSWVPKTAGSCDNGFGSPDTYGIYAQVSPVGSSHSLTDTFSNPLLTMSQQGFVTLEGMSNSTTAFQVDNTSGSGVLDVDTQNSQVGIGTTAPTTALQVAVNNTTTNNLPLSLQQSGTGNTGIQFTTSSGSIYEGEDTDGSFRISSSTAASSGSAIMGDNAIGGLNENGDLGFLLANQYVASATGSITTVYAYVDSVGASPNNHGEMAIYSDQNGSPHTLLANSSSTVLTAGQWNAFTVPTTAVTAGTNYWLVFESDSNTTGFANTTSNTGYPAVNESLTYGSTLPTTWATSNTANGNEGSFYATITSSTAATDSLANTGSSVNILGKTSGTSVDTNDGNFMNCTQFTPSIGGTTSYMTVGMGTSSPSASFSFAIYTGTATQPTTKVATSSIGTLTSNQGLDSLPISTTLTAGTTYWLCMNDSDTNASTSDFTINSDSIATWYSAQTFGSGWPATISSPSGTQATGSIDMSITYTASGSSTGGLMTMTSTGQTTFQSINNSSSAFVIQNSVDINMLSVNTTANTIQIGSSTANSNGILLVLNNYNQSTEPAETDGAMYYNTVTRSFRCGEGGVWYSCLGGLRFTNTDQSSLPSGDTIANTTTAKNFTENYTIPANDCVQGRVFRVTASGTYTTTSSTPPTLGISILLGSTAVAKQQSAETTSGGTTNTWGWTLSANVTCTAAPSSTSLVEADGMVQAAVYNAGWFFEPLLNQSASVNTTTNQVLHVQAQWGTASTSNSITLRQLVVEAIGP